MTRVAPDLALASHSIVNTVKSVDVKSDRQEEDPIHGS